MNKGLHASNPEVRKEAVTALSLAAMREPFFSELESMIDDKDVEVRVATIASLEDLRSKRTVAILRKALTDPVPEVGFAAAKALFELGDPEGKQTLLSVVNGETKTSSGFVTKQMRDAMRMMHTPKTTFMFMMRTGIGFAPVPGVGAGVASMQQLLADSGTSGRASAVLLLSKTRDEETTKALRAALADQDWSVRAAAIHSLALWNDPTLAKDIGYLLDDEKEPVRLRAAAAYARLQALKQQRPTKPAPPKAPSKTPPSK